MTIYINRKERCLLYGEEEAVEHMLDVMGLSPSSVSLNEWMSLDDEPVKFMRTEIKDAFFDIPDWEIIKNADRDGNKRTAFDVVADNVFFAEKKAESGETKQGAGYDHSPDIQGDFEEIISPDELPF